MLVRSFVGAEVWSARLAKHSSRILVCFLSGLVATSISVTAVASPDITFNAFGTIGVVHSDESEADFVANSLVAPSGAGHTDDWSGAVDSKLGGQVNVQFSEKLSAVVQIVAQQHYDNSWMPEVEWANIKYQFNDDFSIRVGRTVASSLMMSDTRLVGYANLWVRPPAGLYSMVPITNMDGIDGSFKFHFGDVLSTTQIGFGSNTFKIPGGVKIKGKNAWIISNSIDVGEATFRLGFIAADVDLESSDVEALTNGYTALGNTLSLIPGLEQSAGDALSLGNRYEGNNQSTEIYSASIRYEPGSWLLMGEWSKLTDMSIIPTTEAWYATVGYRIADVTPYFTYTQVNPDSPSEPDLSTVGMPPLLAGAGQALNTGLNAALAATFTSQKSVAIGVRWDFHNNMALKLQAQRIDLDSQSAGRLVNIQPGFKPGGDVNLFSAVIDFVF